MCINHNILYYNNRSGGWYRKRTSF